MKVTRREFVRTAAIGTTGLLLARYGVRKVYAFNQTPTTPLWGTVLRGVGPGGIPVALPDPLAAPVTGVTHYTMDIVQHRETLNPTLGPTTLWGFNPTIGLGGYANPTHLGGVIVAERNQPVQITFRNKLTSNGLPNGTPLPHPIPIDITVPGDFGALPSGQNNRIAVHMHGSHVPWISDGGPFDWFTPNGVRGASFLNNSVLNPTAAANEAEYYYPNDQSARMMWYHDHAFGMDRCSAYAGVATAYIIRDTPGLEGNFLRNAGMPDFIEHGGRELPIVIQDKIFCGPDILSKDPTWPGPQNAGDLWYDHVYDIPLGPSPLGPPPDPSCVPEFFGDTMLVNGTVYPEATVEARRYRLRILNACNSRFMNLQLYVDDGSPNGITLDKKGNPLNTPALNLAAGNPGGNATDNFLVIGTEGGFLPRPALVPTGVPFGGATVGSLIMAPAERADVIFDFAKHVGQKLILYNDAPAPFPGGDPLNDYFPGLDNDNQVNDLTPAGCGPNTRVLMRFNVVPAVSADPPLAINKKTNLTAGNEPLLVRVGSVDVPAGFPVRNLTLNELYDGYGRLIQRLGTNVVNPATEGFDRGYEDPPTETPLAGSTEIWQIANLTGDTHPIHFHLVNVQIISRQRFAAKSYKGTPHYNAAPVPPADFEAGWKETVRMNPGEVTTVMMRFNLPTVQNVASIPSTPRFAGGGAEYVWHCHILEHEEHDMMRPLIVI